MSEDNFRVIEILDEYSILINYGRTEGASEGDRIRIISKGPEIIDPVTNEILGTLDSIKSSLTLATVYDKFSLCQKIVTTTKSILVNPLSQFQTTSKTIESINIDKSQISDKKLPGDNKIKIGDLVEILNNDTY